MIKNPLIIIIVILSILLFFLWGTDHFDFQFINQDISSKIDYKHIDAVHASSIIILTVILACIAWIQLNGIKRTEQSEFLFKIDERFGEENILRAKVIIHELYLQSKKEYSEYTELQHREQIGILINEISKDENRIKDYVCLLNLLNFLESISLLTNKGYISIANISDLMNQSLDFFYTIFLPRIQDRRSKYKDSTFYVEFEKLIKKIERRKKSCIYRLLIDNGVWR